MWQKSGMQQKYSDAGNTGYLEKQIASICLLAETFVQLISKLISLKIVMHYLLVLKVCSTSFHFSFGSFLFVCVIPKICQADSLPV